MKFQDNHTGVPKHKTVISFVLSVMIQAVILFALTGCDDPATSYTKSGFALDTIVSITVYDTDKAHANAVLEEAFSQCLFYESLFSISDPASDVYRLNHANGEAVTVSADTYTLLEKAVGYAETSGGLLDVTIQPVYALWDFQDTTDREPPSADEIRQELAKVDYRNIRLLDGHAVMLSNDAQVNLGAVAKGYIADRLKEFLVEKGTDSALINLGGNIQAIGEKPDHTPFQIGLATPFDENSSILTEVPVTDRSVVTSGIYQRYFKNGDTIFHHILDPRTGYPVDTDLNAAVIITDSSLDADAWSTICMLLGSKQAGSFLFDLKDTDAVLIDRNNRILPLH